MGSITQVEEHVDWQTMQKISNGVREKAVEQLLEALEESKNRDGCSLTWGDEIEYQLMSFDHTRKEVNLLLKQAELLEALQQRHEKKDMEVEIASLRNSPDFQPEFGAFMVERNPGQPYGSTLENLLHVEEDMKRRREMIQEELGPDEAVLTMTAFPRLGSTPQSGTDHLPLGGNLLKSQVLSDQMVSNILRYRRILGNIAARRGRSFQVKVPVFPDKNTNLARRKSFSEPYQQSGKAPAGDEDSKTHIYGDTLAFGPTCCGLQVTLQASNMHEARMLHDQLIPLGPIMMALTAATPFFRGYLTDTDARWNRSTLASDDRTTDEVDPGEGQRARPPRWSCAPMYIASDPRLRPEYQSSLPLDTTVQHRLEQNNIDPTLARYYAHLLTYDPVALSSDDLKPNNQANFFQIIHSTFWPHVDLRTPPAGSNAGWRTEFRPMEVQPTDFHNAAFAIFISLLRHAISHFQLNFYLPIDKVAENMDRAHTRGAVHTDTFYWRKNVFDQSDGAGGPVEEEYALLTLDEIVNGRSGPGLLPIMEQYLDTFSTDAATREKINTYLALIGGRASGKIHTPAAWMREFVQSHQGYSSDRVVSEEVCYDLLKTIRGWATSDEGKTPLRGECKLPFVDQCTCLVNGVQGQLGRC